MDEKLLKKYLEYTNTNEAIAILFVKKHITQSKGHWVDIIDCQRYEKSPNKLHFRFVKGSLYKRNIHPKYPSKSEFIINGKFDEHRYYLMIRAITWETAHKDIEQQKSKNVASQKFKIIGVSYDKNRDQKNFFRKDAPPEIKALANNLNNRTNPLWDKALQYANKPEFIYEIKKVEINNLIDEANYVCEVKDDKLKVNRSISSYNIKKYESGSKKSEVNCQVTLTFTNGDKYEGEFKNGKYNGHGIFTYSDGTKYIGEFNDNEYNGKGTMIFSDGKSKTGIWRDNVFIKEVKK